MANISYQIARKIVTILRELVAELEAEKRGRPRATRRGRPKRYNDSDILVMLALASIMGLSLRGLYHRLKNSRLWARLFNLKPANIPHLATLARRKNDSDLRRLRDRLYKKTTTNLASGIAAFIDASAIEADPKLHPNANWGYSSKGMFYGYQLHLACDLKGAVLFFTVTKASSKEIAPAKYVLKEAKKINPKLKYLTGDASYDVTALYRYCRKELDAKLIARINPRRAITVDNAISLAKGERKRAFRLTCSRFGTILLNKRAVVEQVFSQLKEIIRIDELPFWVKKLSHAKEHIKWLILAYNVLLYTNKVHAENLRSIKRLVA